MSDLDDHFLGDKPLVFTHKPEMLATYYGVQISTVGEDGDWIALGHVRPLRFLAAMCKASRDDIGWPMEGGDDLVEYVEHRRAVFKHPVGNTYEWWCWHGPTVADHEHAIDVTYWSEP